MSVQTSIVSESIDRVQEAFQSMGDEFGRLQGQLDGRFREIEADTQKRVKKLAKDLRKQPLWKRADALRRDTTKQIEQGIDGVLSSLQIASTSDMKKLDRKLNSIGKRLKAMETRAKANGAAPKNL